jgi:hypothetical protein
MFIKLELVNGNVEMFETNNFVCAPKAEMNPDILKCEVFDSSGKRRYVSERHFKSFYKKYLYKPAAGTKGDEGK